MTVSLEKVFFNYILDNRKYFEFVEPYFFKNSEIQFVYQIVRDYMMKKSDIQKPSPKQILEMVQLEDRENKITRTILKSILKTDMDQYSEQDFILPKFKGWVLINRLKTGTIDIIDETREFDENCDFEYAVESADKIRQIVDDMSSTRFVDDDDIGSDFDDPESHVQDNSLLKIKSGFETIDHMLGGGWDVKTLNCIMAETSNGKCFFGDGKIKVRNKNKNEVFDIKIEKMFSKIGKGA